MIHSKKLEETVLWKVYQEKGASDNKRVGWVKNVYEGAVEYLKDVRLTFQNYTLHDETHILNVMDAMGGVLGNQIMQLTVGEMELLILAACLHDLGMVYTEEEKQRWYYDEDACKKFIQEYCPEYMGDISEYWPKYVKQWYLRTLHPYRLPEILIKKEWKKLFEECPLEIVPKRCVLAVCQAHGENPTELYINKDLEYLSAYDVDPLFCTLLLRLSDLLDFDDTRVPKILYSYGVCNENSRIEWDKHRVSAGFRYPVSPSRDDLPYKARCTDPGVEHAIRDFLDWIDEELDNCKKLQKYCRRSWHQEFAFPGKILRDEIESDGYESGDFCLTMDQTQIIKLLTGENLYENRHVFIRELLQNAIDATLLRGEMDSDFIPEKSRIDLWEWNDKEGNIWFRIDDQGTGMTSGMLQRYLLKIGNSYYNSRELERDLQERGRIKKYNGISCFGIGFLSNFLCGDYIEVSTLYFDSNKNRKEESAIDSYQTKHYGLRLHVTGLSGYYILKNQSRHHQIDEKLPIPNCHDVDMQDNLEQEGYRVKPGTSIAVRLAPGKLGTRNLYEVAENYLCGTRIPIYYNGKRIGKTYEELMQSAHKIAGKKFYELTSKLKEQFDHSFPAVCGQYPKIAITVIPLDTDENQILPEFSGVFLKCYVHFDNNVQWKVKDQSYEISIDIFNTLNGDLEIELSSKNMSAVEAVDEQWIKLKKEYGLEKMSALEAEFETYLCCPNVERLKKEVWQPFMEKMNIYEAWRAYCDYQQEVKMKFSTLELGIFNMGVRFSNKYFRDMIYTYHGIVVDDDGYLGDGNYAIFMLGDTWKPMVQLSRSRILKLPLKVLIASYGLLRKYQMSNHMTYRGYGKFFSWNEASLKEWREVRNSSVGQWMIRNHGDILKKIKQALQNSVNTKGIFPFTISLDDNIENSIECRYWAAHFQDNYGMMINYEKGQVVLFCEEKEGEMQNVFDLFPPMMFCKAASDQSRQYICSANCSIRRSITVDHPFIIWLLENAIKLNQYYQWQFQQIVGCLWGAEAEDIIQNCNEIRNQLIALPEHHGVSVRFCPKLSIDDFWIE